MSSKHDTTASAFGVLSRTVPVVPSDVAKVGHGIAKAGVRLKSHQDAGLLKVALYSSDTVCSDH